MGALDDDSNTANLIKVELDARLFTPEQYARKFAEKTKLNKIPKSTELGWNVDATPAAGDNDAGDIVWKLTGDTYEFSDVRFPEDSGKFYRDAAFDKDDVKVGRRIDFRFQAIIQSSMQNEPGPDVQIISKIWYDHPDQCPLRNVEVEDPDE